MKGLKLFLAACLAPLVFQPAVADDASDIARAGTRRNTQQNISTTRQRTKTETKNQTSTVASRTTGTKKATPAVRERAASDTPTARTGNTVSDSARATKTTTEKKSVSARATTQTIQPRTIKTSAQIKTRNATTPTRNISRSATLARATTSTPVTKTRNATTPTRNISRSATLARATTSADILSRNFSKCRDVFHSCMDEFCANKDSQLRRCACSARVNEFDKTKEQLARVEDKLLNFSERLLTVNMDEEDVIAMNQATEGELAFTKDDTSASKKMLDKIAKKLNTSFDDSNFDNSLNAISLTLNTDSAFDNVDSLAGASTTLKTGTDLYISALPVCREMAQEVCTPDELKIAESGYQMAIEQDCNTVAKSYQTQTDQARAKVLESGALLDISRLDIYQERNSDDILTCKKKMLDMLSDATVCGENLGKCLDTSGRYIDPTTGAAFLTNDLSQLGNLITRPTGDQTWTRVPENSEFVSFLNTKKEFLEPAMSNCQNIADSVWDAFVEDALAQIKLAQDKKLEEVRQSCTTLTAECLTDANKTIADFDARALSIFGIMADKTANTMCADIKNACGALLESSGGGTDWIGGMSQIASEITFDTILHTCREVGRNCIINTCKSTSGNFGLCENIDTSINRKSIINRTACWDEVVQCVASAGTDTLNEIKKIHPLIGGNFYKQMYNFDTDNLEYECSTYDAAQETNECIFDICTNECAQNADETSCYTCRLAEQIWGNCEAAPKNISRLASTNQRNKIKESLDKETNKPTGTLLSWFALNTNTLDRDDSCRDTTCEYGYEYNNETHTCRKCNNYTNDGHCCSKDYMLTIEGDKITNCCTSEIRDSFGNCCTNKESKEIDIDNRFGTTTVTIDAKDTKPNKLTICVPKSDINVTHVVSYEQSGITVNQNNETRTYSVFCLGQLSDDEYSDFDGFPNGRGLTCNGEYLVIDNTGYYYIVKEPELHTIYDRNIKYCNDGESCDFDPNSYNKYDTSPIALNPISSYIIDGKTYKYEIQYSKKNGLGEYGNIESINVINPADETDTNGTDAKHWQIVFPETN